MSMHEFDAARIMGGIYGDGIVGLKEAFSRPWVKELAEDFLILSEEAQRRPKGVLNRGPNRFYVEIHPERLRGFRELVTHPWILVVCETVLGPNFHFVEFGFDVPGPGAKDQPWHRDFAPPVETREGRKISSLAFNISTVDVKEDMGPFEIALGTQWDDSEDFVQGMFPPTSSYPRYNARSERKLPQMGDVSARTALTVHRGTANRSSIARPVLVVGAEAPDAFKAIQHNMQISREFFTSLPKDVQRHLDCKVVETLTPIEQHHVIEGLLHEVREY